MPQEKIIHQDHILKIGEASFTERIDNLILLYQVTKTEPNTYQATLSLKFQENEIPLSEAPFPLTLHKNLRSFVEDFEKTKHDKAPYKLEFGKEGMETLKQEERLFGVMRQAFWNAEFQAVINPLREAQETGLIGQIWLMIASEEAFIRNLPWEVMLWREMDESKNGRPLPRLSIVRTTCGRLQDMVTEPQTPAKEPLRLLFVTSLPERMEERHKLLQVEQEQRRLIERLMETATEGVPMIEIDFAEIASLEEIDTLLAEGRHQIVHISGHGDFKQPSLSPEQAVQPPSNQVETKGLLVMEDEDGNRVDVSGGELGAVLRKHPSVRLVVLSNCNSAKAGAEGLAEEVAKQGIPAVVGMRFTVTDFAAMEFTTALYGALSQGLSLAEAFQAGQSALYWIADSNGKRYPDTEWFTPVMHLRELMGTMVDVEAAKEVASSRVQAKMAGQQAHLERNFIGRRRYLAKIKRVLEGSGHLCLFGMRGIGKSALARVAAERFAGGNVVVATAPLDLSGRFAAGERAVVIVDDFDWGDLALREWVLGLLGGSWIKVIVVSGVAQRGFGELVGCICVWKLSYAEQVRFVKGSKAFWPYEGQTKPNFGDFEPIFQRLDGHLDALKRLESELSGFKRDDWKGEIAHRVEMVVEDLRKHQVSGQNTSILDSSAHKTYAQAAVFFSASPVAALVTATGGSEEELCAQLLVLSEHGICFFDGEVFEVHPILRNWILINQLLDNADIQNLVNRIGSYFRNGDSIESLILAVAYFEKGENLLAVAETSLRLQSIYKRMGLYRRSIESNEFIIDRISNSDLRKHVLANLGEIYLLLAEHKKALDYFQQAEELYTSSNEKGNDSLCNNIGQVYYAMGAFDLSLEYIQRALKIVQISQNLQLEATITNNLGQMHRMLGNFDMALELFEKAINIKRSVGDTYQIGGIYNNIGQIYMRRDEHENALKFLRMGLESVELEGDIYLTALIHSNLGQMAKMLGNIDLAMSHYELSLNIRSEIGDIQGQGRVLCRIGTLFVENKEYDKSHSYLIRSLEIQEGIGDLFGKGITFYEMGHRHLEMGDLDASHDLLIESLKIFKDLANKPEIYNSLYLLARIASSYNNFETELSILNECLRIAIDLKNFDDIIGVKYDIGVTLVQLGNFEDAIKPLFQAYFLLEQKDSPQAQAPGDCLMRIMKEIGEKRFYEILKPLQSEYGV